MRTDKETRRLSEVVLTNKVQPWFVLTTRRVLLALLGLAYVVLWIGGIGTYVLADSNSDRGWIAALFLSLAGTIVLVGTRSWTERLLLTGIAVLGFVAEVIGVHSQVPFGAYSYTAALGPRLLDVPLAMAFAWMTLAAYVQQVLRQTNLSSWSRIILGATCLTAFDLVIDPLASNQLAYWQWSTRGLYFGVPLTNFAGWFVVSIVAMSLLRKRFESNFTIILMGLSLIVFFTLLTFLIGERTVALFGTVLCSLVTFFHLRRFKIRDCCRGTLASGHR